MQIEASYLVKRFRERSDVFLTKNVLVYDLLVCTHLFLLYLLE
jgi:hypothetical protein